MISLVLLVSWQLTPSWVPVPEPPVVAKRNAEDLRGFGVVLLALGGAGFLGGVATIGYGVNRSVGDSLSCAFDIFAGECPSYDYSRYYIGGGVAMGVGAALLFGGVAAVLIGEKRLRSLRLNERGLAFHF